MNGANESGLVMIWQDFEREVRDQKRGVSLTLYLPQTSVDITMSGTNLVD